MVASCTPCVASATVSRAGHFVALMRRRRSTSASSGTWMEKGRIASALVIPICESPWFDGWLARCAGSRLKAPAAAAVARKLRRVGDNDIADMIILLGGNATSLSLAPHLTDFVSLCATGGRPRRYPNTESAARRWRRRNAMERRPRSLSLRKDRRLFPGRALLGCQHRLDQEGS